MADGNLTHLTQEKTRWDRLAYEYYGDPTAYERIMLANPHLTFGHTLPSGVKVSIPLITPIAESATGVPPWKR